jgi:hypothetical protein
MHGHGVDPASRQVSQRHQVLGPSQHLSLEAPHLAGGCGLLRYGATADNPTHCRITSQTVGIVHVLVAAKAAEDGLAKQACHRMLAVLACARINECITDYAGQPEGIIEFAGKQAVQRRT